MAASCSKEENEEEGSKDREVGGGIGQEEEEKESPINFSSLIDRHRLTNEEIEACLTRGIRMDITASTSTPGYPLVTPAHNFRKEIEKSLNCPYWPSDEEFLSNFNFEGIEEPYLTKLKNLLCLFKHCYWNADRKEMFQKGVQNVPPLKIQKLPNVIPRKDKVRVTPDKKLPYLRKQTEELVEMGVIREVVAAAEAATV